MMRYQLRAFFLWLLLWGPICNGFTAGVSSGLQLALPTHLPKSAGSSAATHKSIVAAQTGTTDESFDTETNDSPLSFSASSSLANYHLVWSPQVWKKMIFTSLVLWIFHRSIKFQVPRIPQNNILFYDIILPTLSSACCWIQMILNMVTAFGCAGFNTYLGPLRPFFLGLLTHLTFMFRHHTNALTMVFRWTIALLPELLHFWNARTVTVAAAGGGGGGRQPKTKNAALEENNGTKQVVTVYLDCPTMGCVACIQNVNSSLHKALLSNPSMGVVQKVDSWLLDGDQKGGKAKLQFSALDGKTEQFKDEEWDQFLVGAMEKAGFPCTVTDVTMEPPTAVSPAS